MLIPLINKINSLRKDCNVMIIEISYNVHNKRQFRMGIIDKVSAMYKYFVFRTNNLMNRAKCPKFPISRRNLYDIVIWIPFLKQSKPTHKLSLITKITMGWRTE